MFKTSGKLYCFSPPVMLVTFVVEVLLAAYTVVRYKMNTVVRLSVSILVILAVFQLAEYGVCGHASNITLIWSRIGYLAITLLPPLALHLVMTIAKKKARALVWLAYGTSLIFALIFGFSSSAFIGYVCAGNYAIFHLVHPLGGYYFAYYYSWLFVGVGLSLFYSLQAQKKVREALVLQICGYLSILLPTGIVNAINPQTIYGIPSIMCGFAIIYAITLAIGIVPATQEL